MGFTCVAGVFVVPRRCAFRIALHCLSACICLMCVGIVLQIVLFRSVVCVGSVGM